MQQHETAIRNAILIRLSALQWEGRRACVVTRRFVGKVRAFGDPSIVFNVGIPGQYDCCGFLCSGRAFEVEVKTKEGRTSAGQDAWHALCQEMNVLVIVARSPEDAEKAVLDALAS